MDMNNTMKCMTTVLFAIVGAIAFSSTASAAPLPGVPLYTTWNTSVNTTTGYHVVATPVYMATSTFCLTNIRFTTRTTRRAIATARYNNTLPVTLTFTTPVSTRHPVFSCMRITARTMNVNLPLTHAAVCGM